MIKNYRYILSSLVLSLIFAVTSILPIGAIANGNAINTQETTNSNQRRSGKLEAAKLRICQAKENRIKNMFSNMNQLGQGQLNLFDNTLEKVKHFYATKNLQIDNYDELITAIEAARTAAQQAIQTASNFGDSFKCDADDPQGTASQYKNQVQVQIQELKNYRTMIKDLISTIKAHLEDNSTSDTEGEQ